MRAFRSVQPDPPVPDASVEPRIARPSDVAPFLAMDVLPEANRLAAAGRDVLHLEVGGPGERPPRAVPGSSRSCAPGERLGYTEALGIQPLRRALAER